MNITDYPIDSEHYRSTTTQDERIRFLILHYTAENFSQSMANLAGDTATVSVHYVIPDPDEVTYLQAGFSGNRIFALVDEGRRAWHAGVSQWQGRTNLNDTSIGIEIVNQASGNTDGAMTFPPFSEQQVQMTIALCKDILSRHPTITARQVLAHADIAWARRRDPGPAFPWQRLYEAGIGAWPDAADVTAFTQRFEREGLPSGDDMKTSFSRYGYSVPNGLSSSDYTMLVVCFQMHFRPARYDGRVDIETAAILYALLKKYVG